MIGLYTAAVGAFHWRDSGEVYHVADWRRDFYFTTDDMNGGLCRYESIVRGKNGKAYTAVKYAIHTCLCE